MAVDIATISEILVATASLAIALASLRLAKLAQKEEEELFGKWIPTMEIKLSTEIKKTGYDRILFLTIDLQNAGKIMTIPSWFIINLWQYRPKSETERPTLLFEKEESYTIFFRQKLEYNKKTLPNVTYNPSLEGKALLTPFSSEKEGEKIVRYDGNCNQSHWQYRSRDILEYRYKQGEGRKYIFPITIHGHGTYCFRVQIGFLRQKEVKGQMMLDLSTEDFQEVGKLEGWKDVLKEDPSIDPKELVLITGHYAYTEDIYDLVPAYDDINHKLEVAKVFVEQKKHSRAIQELNKMTPEEKDNYSEEVAEFYFKSAQGWEKKEDLKVTDSAKEVTKKQTQRISFDQALQYFKEAYKLNPDKKIYKENYDRMKSLSKYGEEIADKIPRVNPLAVEIGSDIMNAIIVPSSNDLRKETLEEVEEIRKRILNTYGVKIPGIRFRDNNNLGPQDFTVLVDEVQVGKGSVNKNETMIIKSLMNAIRPIIEEHLGDFVGHDFVKNILYGVATFEIEEKNLSAFTQILRKLVKDKIPITSLEAIVQEFNTCLSENKDLTETYQNMRLLPSIRNVLPGNDENFQIFQLGDKIEEKIKNSIKDAGYQKILDMDPSAVVNILSKIREYSTQYKDMAIAVKNPSIREFTQELINIEFKIPCLSRNELQRFLLNRIKGEIEIV
ncbi:MAG: FHIPEP family type III secretion protein [Candidatus Lokiarchaeota archaeon]|nr:FHIPEP family type III secretion protein [Candidatus Lokiarchaeota archaeon]